MANLDTACCGKKDIIVQHGEPVFVDFTQENPKKCACGPGVAFACINPEDSHVVQLDTKQQYDEASEEAATREWEAHTTKYLDEFEGFYMGLNVNSTDGELLFKKWQEEYHPKLCCDLRHMNWELMYDF